MSIWKVIFACVCVIGLSQFVWSQDHNIGARAQSSTESPEAAAATVYEYYGTYVINIAIGIHTTIPTTDVISCSAEADLFDAYGSYTDTAATIATRSGSNANCTLTINYFYLLTSPTTDQVEVSFKVNALETVTVGSGTSAVTEAASARQTTRTLPGFAVPLVNATTTISVGTRL